MQENKMWNVCVIPEKTKTDKQKVLKPSYIPFVSTATLC